MNYYLFYTLFLLLNPLSLIFFCIIILSTSSILLCSFTLKSVCHSVCNKLFSSLTENQALKQATQAELVIYSDLN